jgi:hypothetical protein
MTTSGRRELRTSTSSPCAASSTQAPVPMLIVDLIQLSSSSGILSPVWARPRAKSGDLSQGSMRRAVSKSPACQRPTSEPTGVMTNTGADGPLSRVVREISARRHLHRDQHIELSQQRCWRLERRTRRRCRGCGDDQAGCGNFVRRGGPIKDRLSPTFRVFDPVSYTGMLPIGSQPSRSCPAFSLVSQSSAARAREPHVGPPPACSAGAALIPRRNPSRATRGRQPTSRAAAYRYCMR